MAIEYDDFSVRLTALGEGRFQAQVVESPAGTGTEALQLEAFGELDDWSPVQLEGWWRSRLRELYEPGEKKTSASGPSSEAVGHALYSFLFRGLVRDLFERSLGATQAVQRGLRLVLRFDPRESGIAQLTSLPWELLYKKETEQFLTLDPRTPVVRFLDVPQAITLPPLKETLRVLVVSPAAKDLDVERERKLLAETLQGLPVDVRFLTVATREELVRSLARERSHVLHFIGHGGIDGATGQGFLSLTGPDGVPDLLSGADLADIVCNSAGLRFVFLNACRSAVEPAAFAGVANALLLRGAPAVLAMQARVADDDAILFAQAVYLSLTYGSPLEEAVSAGRCRLYARARVKSVLATPVLFSRTRKQIVPVVNPLGLSALWTVLGLLALSLTFNGWSRAQGWDILLPGFEFGNIDRYAVGIYGILLGVPLLAFLLNVTQRFQRIRAGTTFADRLPMAFGIYPSLLGPSWRSHQALFFFLFLLFPMAGQIHFNAKMWGGTAYHRTTGEPSGPWDWKPLASVLEDKHSFANPDSDDEKITFYPFWEPLVFLLAEIALWLYFVRVSFDLFGWDKRWFRRGSPVPSPG